MRQAPLFFKFLLVFSVAVSLQAVANDFTSKDPWTVLGVPKAASEFEIAAQFNRLTRQHNPQLVDSDSAEFTQRQQIIDKLLWAYREIKNSSKTSAAPLAPAQIFVKGKNTLPPQFLQVINGQAVTGFLSDLDLPDTQATRRLVAITLWQHALVDDTRLHPLVRDIILAEAENITMQQQLEMAGEFIYLMSTYFAKLDVLPGAAFKSFQLVLDMAKQLVEMELPEWSPGSFEYNKRETIERVVLMGARTLTFLHDAEADAYMTRLFDFISELLRAPPMQRHRLALLLGNAKYSYDLDFYLTAWKGSLAAVKMYSDVLNMNSDIIRPNDYTMLADLLFRHPGQSASFFKMTEAIINDGKAANIISELRTRYYRKGWVFDNAFSSALFARYGEAHAAFINSVQNQHQYQVINAIFRNDATKLPNPYVRWQISNIKTATKAASFIKKNNYSVVDDAPLADVPSPVTAICSKWVGSAAGAN